MRTAMTRTPRNFRTSMAKLRFVYGPMNSGKSMLLLAKAYNFDERGIPYLIFKSAVDPISVGGRLPRSNTTVRVALSIPSQMQDENEV